MKLGIAILATLSFFGWVGARIIADINFDRNCKGFLKRAADANTIELAIENLEVSVKYAEQNGLTSGFTSVLYRTPDEDVGFWYKNLVASLKELRTVEPETPKLERTNILMKLRETLLDQGQSTSVTSPSGISIYPSNKDYMWWCLISVFLAFIFGFLAATDGPYSRY